MELVYEVTESERNESGLPEIRAACKFALGTAAECCSCADGVCRFSDSSACGHIRVAIGSACLQETATITGRRMMETTRLTTMQMQKDGEKVALESHKRTMEEERRHWEAQSKERPSEAAKFRSKPPDKPKRPELKRPVLPFCALPAPVTVPADEYKLFWGIAVRTGSVLEVEFVDGKTASYRYAGSFTNATSTLLCRDMFSSGVRVGKVKSGTAPLSIFSRSFSSLEDLARSKLDFSPGVVVHGDVNVEFRTVSATGEKVDGSFSMLEPSAIYAYKRMTLKA